MASRPLFIVTRRLSIGCALLTLATGAGAAPTPKPAKRAHVVVASSRLPSNTIERLQSGDPARVESAIDDVRVAGSAGAVAVPTIASLLRQGMPLSLTQAALETLGETESSEASDVLAWYSRHREVEVRKAAVRALGHAGGPEAVRSLRVALTDSEPTVRALAATSLGTLHAHDAVPDLFAALDHEVKEAAASLGQVCEPSDCEKLMGTLGRLPFDVVTSGLERVLFRPAAEVSDDFKVAMVASLRDLGTAGAHAFLRSVQARWPKGGSARVRDAIGEAVRATSASPGRRPAGAVQ